MIFNNEGSNVYNIEKDKWLLDKKDETITYLRQIDEDRAVFITANFKQLL